jgi:hypothetical protein
MALAPIKSLVHKEQKLFVWRYLSAKQKMVSLRPGLFLSSLFFGNILLGASNHLRVAPCPILVI